MSRRTLTPDDPRHGTYNGYNNFRCRCEPCRNAAKEWRISYGMNDYYREWTHRTGRAKPRAEHLAEIEPPHGTESRYSNKKWRCRCDECRAAATAAKRARRARSRIPCVTCGTLVDGINRRTPDKPPECQPCAARRTGKGLKFTVRPADYSY